MSTKNRDAARKVREMQAAQRAKEKRRQTMIMSGAVVLVLAIVVGIAIAVQAGRDDTPTNAAAPAGVVDSYGIPDSDSSAPVTLTLYEDFQCPICRQYEEWLGDTIAQQVDAGNLQVIYRPVSYLDRMSSTDYSSRALETAACVLNDDGPSTFLKLHQLLFANQPAENTAGLSDAELAGLAAQAGADRASVEACQSDDTYAGWVRAASDQASKDHVRGTPTFRINGDDVPVTSATDQVSAIRALEDAIAGAGGE